MKKLLIPALAATLCLGLNSCKKEEVVKTTKINTAYRAEVSNELMDFVGNFVQTDSRSGMFRTSGVQFDNLCATITKDSSQPLKVMVIDWGSGCTDPVTGFFESGKLTITFNEKDLGLPGAHMTYLFENYFSSKKGHTWNGTFEFENLGTNGSGNSHGTIGINMVVNSNNGDPDMTVVVSQALEDDNANSLVLYDVTSDFTDALGNFYRESNTTRLAKSDIVGCSKFFVSGNMLVQESGQSDATMDYGTGRCDDEAIKTQNGVSTVIDLNTY